MTEQVIDIRDRIEKMRTQMTGNSQSAVKKEEVYQKNVIGKNEFQNKEVNETIKNTNTVKKDFGIDKVAKESNSQIKVEKKQNESIEKVGDFSGLKSRQKQVKSKVYRDYQNENIFDDNKKTVKLDDDKPFPQFNLNVSNPISWKLMLLIMLMQLLTNIMLVVVLYLK